MDFIKKVLKYLVFGFLFIIALGILSSIFFPGKANIDPSSSSYVSSSSSSIESQPIEIPSSNSHSQIVSNSYTSSISEVTERSQIVYVTKTGKTYHREGCGYLNKSSIPLTLYEAESKGYTPCSRCW